MKNRLKLIIVIWGITLALVGCTPLQKSNIERQKAWGEEAATAIEYCKQKYGDDVLVEEIYHHHESRKTYIRVVAGVEKFVVHVDEDEIRDNRQQKEILESAVEYLCMGYGIPYPDGYSWRQYGEEDAWAAYDNAEDYSGIYYFTNELYSTEMIENLFFYEDVDEIYNKIEFNFFYLLDEISPEVVLPKKNQNEIKYDHSYIDVYCLGEDTPEDIVKKLVVKDDPFPWCYPHLNLDILSGYLDGDPVWDNEEHKGEKAGRSEVYIDKQIDGLPGAFLYKTEEHNSVEKILKEDISWALDDGQIAISDSYRFYGWDEAYLYIPQDIWSEWNAKYDDIQVAWQTQISKNDSEKILYTTSLEEYRYGDWYIVPMEKDIDRYENVFVIVGRDKL